MVLMNKIKGVFLLYFNVYEIIKVKGSPFTLLFNF